MTTTTDYSTGEVCVTHESCNGMESDCVTGRGRAQPGYDAALQTYAAQTAADNGVDLATGILMLDDEPQIVAEEIGCSAAVVHAWVRAQQ